MLKPIVWKIPISINIQHQEFFEQKQFWNKITFCLTIRRINYLKKIMNNDFKAFLKIKDFHFFKATRTCLLYLKMKTHVNITILKIFLLMYFSKMNKLLTTKTIIHITSLRKILTRYIDRGNWDFLCIFNKESH